MKRNFYLSLFIILFGFCLFTACKEEHTHAFGEWKTVTEATCIVEGTRERECECGLKETGSIEKTEHTYEKATTVEPTCTAEGYTQLRCTDCGETRIDENSIVEMLPHAYEESKQILPTCSTRGYTEVICKDCGATDKRDFVSALPHVYDVVVKTLAPTCTEKGYTVYMCSDCGTEEQSDFIPSTGHTEIVDKAEEATCTTAGLTEGKHCSVCNTVLVEQKTLEKLAHTLKTVKGYAATCTKTGLTDGKKCSVCQTVIEAQNTIAKKPHTEVTMKGYAATCTATGLTDEKKCSVCNTILVEQKTLEKLAHTSETVEGYAATCTATGLTDGKKCSVCQTVIEAQNTIAKKPHTEVTVKGYAATCAKTGLTDGKKCSVCQTVIEAQNAIAKKPHTEVTVKGYAATCAKTGLTDGKKCSVCQTVIEAQNTIAKKPHTEVTVKGYAATCTETGLTDGKKCSVCQTVIEAQSMIAKKPHTEVTVKGYAATCTETGLTDGKKCSVCQTVTKTQTVIDPLNHSFSGAACTRCKALDSSYTQISDYTGLRNIISNMSGKYVLVKDISLSGKDWSVIGSATAAFTGVFDGNGYAIQNLEAKNKSRGGLFYCNAGTIRNLTIENVSFSWIHEENDKTDANVCGDISVVAGAFASENKGTIDDCTLAGTVRYNLTRKIWKYLPSTCQNRTYKADYTVGGFTGTNSGTIKDSFLSGSFTCVNDNFFQYYMSGVLGIGGASCEMKITGNIGGFVGNNTGTVKNCSATGKCTLNSKTQTESLATPLGGTHDVKIYKNISFGSIVGVNSKNIIGCKTKECSITNERYESGKTDHTSNEVYINNSATFNGIVGKNGDGATITGCTLLSD